MVLINNKDEEIKRLTILSEYSKIAKKTHDLELIGHIMLETRDIFKNAKRYRSLKFSEKRQLMELELTLKVLPKKIKKSFTGCVKLEQTQIKREEEEHKQDDIKEEKPVKNN